MSLLMINDYNPKMCLIHHQVLGMLNKVEMLVRVWMPEMASARIGDSDSLLILFSVASSSFSLGGMEFVTMT